MKIINLVIILCFALFDFVAAATTQNVQSADFTAQALNTGLVLYYPFSDNGGASATDASGNGYHGQVVNAQWRDDGPQGGYYSFDGNGDYINVGTAVNFPAWSQYSISLWFLSDGGGDNSGYGQKLIDKTSFMHDAHLRITPTVSATDVGYPNYGLYEGRGTGVGASPTNQVRGDHLWHHIVIVRNGSTCTCWLDGEQGGSVNDAMSVYSSSPLYIGYSASSDDYQRRYWSGYIDEVRIYNRAISVTEVDQLFRLANARFTLTVMNARGDASPTNGVHTFSFGTAVSATVPEAITGTTTRHVAAGASVEGTAFTSYGPTNVVLSVTNNATLTWNWLTEYNLTASADGNGSVSGGGWYTAGTNVLLTASPDAGFQFAGWSDGETTPSRTVVVPEGGASYTALFTPIPRGVLRLQKSAYSVAENAVAVLLKVERVDGSYGAASVSFTVDSGSAIADEDYLGGQATLSWSDGQTGAKSFYIGIMDDDVFEGNETFQVRLVDATGAAVGDPAQAQVTIIDDESAPSIVPRFAGSLDFGEVATNATAIRTVEVWNDGSQMLVVTNVQVPVGFAVTNQTFEVPAGASRPLQVWFTPAQPAAYAGTLTLGCNATSGTVSLAVSGTGVVPTSSIGVRTITGLTAILAVDVPEGASVLGVEEMLSPGLIPVSISDGGIWDAVNRKVKWFFNEPGQVRDRALQYGVSCSGSVVAGLINVGSGDRQITGDTAFAAGDNPGLLHPADDNGDWRVVLAEVSASVSRWKSGLDTQETPVVIRGITLYRQGELYVYDPLVSAEAKRWIPMMTPTSLDTSPTRLLAFPLSESPVGAFRSVQTTNVTLTVTPGAGTSAWGIEETLPEGVQVLNISHEGTWESKHRTIKWAFFDGVARSLSYSIAGEFGTNVTVSGNVSFDGSEDTVTGSSDIVVPLPFKTWANRQGLDGDMGTVFHTTNAERGLPNGLVYAFETSLRPDAPLLVIRWNNGSPVIESPKQDAATLPFVSVSLEWATDLTLTNWSAGPVPAADQSDVAGNRCRWEPSSLPAKAFYRLKAVLK